MMKYTPGKPRNLLAAGLAVLGLLLGATMAHASHSTPPPPLPDGHAGVVVRLVWLPGPGEPVLDGQVGVETIELHRKGAASGESWVSLPLLRSEFSSKELIGGQVWVANAPVAAGEFDQVRLGSGARSQVSIPMRLVPGQWTIVTLYTAFQKARARGPLRLELKRALTQLSD